MIPLIAVGLLSIVTGCIALATHKDYTHASKRADIFEEELKRKADHDASETWGDTKLSRSDLLGFHAYIKKAWVPNQWYSALDRKFQLLLTHDAMRNVVYDDISRVCLHHGTHEGRTQWSVRCTNIPLDCTHFVEREILENSRVLYAWIE